MSLRAHVAGRVIQAFAPLALRPPAALRFPDVRMAATVTHRVPTEAGYVTCTAYHPVTKPDHKNPGVYVNFHGGGYVIRYAKQDDPLCRYLAHHTGCVVLNVNYDVAPQRPFPAAALQAHGVCTWVTASAAEHGWDGKKLAVGGQSAGGALAAAACRLARDRGTFSPLLQVLVYPPLDLTVPPAQKRGKAARPVVGPGLARLFDDAYTPDPRTREDPLVSPATAADLTGLPPTLLITAELDPLAEEGHRFAAALDAADVPLVHREFPDVDHAFTHRKPVAPAVEAYELMAETVAKAMT